MPQSLPSWPYDDHVTTKPPSLSAVTEEYLVVEVYVLARNSLPTGVPSAA